MPRGKRKTCDEKLDEVRGQLEELESRVRELKAREKELLKEKKEAELGQIVELMEHKKLTANQLAEFIAQLGDGECQACEN